MKRKIAFSLSCIAAVGGAWSCLTLGQDPFGQTISEVPARAPRTTVTRTLNSSGQLLTETVAGPPGMSNGKTNIATLAKQLNSAEGAEKADLLAKLKTLVSQQFDERQELKTKELKALEEQLAKLKEIHAKRTQQRDMIVSDRIQQILREADGLGWGTSDSSDGFGMTFSGTAAARRPSLLGGLSEYATEVAAPASPIAPATGLPGMSGAPGAAATSGPAGIGLGRP